MFLLDTNVISELRKPNANHGVKVWAHGITPNRLFLSAITLLELETGILRVERRDPDQGALLRSWLERRVLLAFTGRILPIDNEVALRCAQLHIADRSNECGALIAATALVHGLTVVTRNVADFEHCGVRLLNPWQD
ncbi:type II toxin-antitoxin system VapC family toxin [Pseudomonas sp. MAFF 302046]|uniref:Ribonuclease VapC n=1 Tax=Pseudomonas morbosilactucae TaxID=2938197 RepID=A0ABT0JLI6_9PSED|nr:type II toxin-antitoxin system VapC family toxin [Pseudomonas morbosilactucae]MCK9816798.1 type II toxin-antitoxin system VapC family toxin [Pseudomonas morbosilactucae]